MIRNMLSSSKVLVFVMLYGFSMVSHAVEAEKNKENHQKAVKAPNQMQSTTSTTSSQTSKDSYTTKNNNADQKNDNDESNTQDNMDPKERAVIAQKNLEESQKFFENNKKKSGIKTLPSGLQYEVIKEGKGNPPISTDYIKLLFRGTLLNGTEFDKTTDKPELFEVEGIIPGLSEALKMMSPGAKWKVFVPPQLAYGVRGIPGKIGPNAGVIFDVELVSIESVPDDDVTDVMEYDDLNPIQR